MSTRNCKLSPIITQKCNWNNSPIRQFGKTLNFSKKSEVTTFLLGTEYIQRYLSVKSFIVTIALKKTPESIKMSADEAIIT